MKKYIFLFSLFLILTSCDNSTQIIEKKQETHLLPQPKELITSSQTLILTAESKSFSPNEKIGDLLQLFSNELELITGIKLEQEEKMSSNSDVIFELDHSLEKEEYQMNISHKIEIRGGSYPALVMAKNSLLQLVIKQESSLAFPVLQIKDRPDANYRGLMLDLARQWHKIETIEKVIDMAAFYKTNYLHLHFSDYQSYTLPSKVLPKLSTEGKTYNFEELKALESYANLRGITIIPEIDIPGHSSPFVEKYPEIFSIDAMDENPWIINMGKEEVYQNLELLIEEICGIFKSTPYFHIGGDEAIFHKTMEDASVIAYMQEKDLGTDVHELYRHFLVRMNEIIKKQNKKMCVWEGFRREGQVEIPKDILVFEFETNRYLPNHLLEDGYHVVNTSWKPLYVVNKKKWEPKTIYGWNMWRWENWYPKAPSFTPIQVEQSPLIVGAEMCAWEQAGASEIPSLRKRLPTMMERIWNTDKKIPYQQFMLQLEETDKRLSLLISDERQDPVLLDHNFTAEME